MSIEQQGNGVCKKPSGRIISNDQRAGLQFMLIQTLTMASSKPTTLTKASKAN